MLSSLSDAERSRRELRAETLIDVIAFNEELFGRDRANDTPSPEAPHVQLLLGAFSYWFIIREPSKTDPYARDHALIACMKTVDAVIAPRASGRGA
jgi:hypothetical protein